MDESRLYQLQLKFGPVKESVKILNKSADEFESIYLSF